MKKGDILILSVAVFLLAVATVALPWKKGSTVVVKQNNQTVYKGSILKDTTVELSGNTLIVKDGFVYMESASCKNKVCKHTGKINKKGESIICLPNKVVAEIK